MASNGGNGHHSIEMDEKRTAPPPSSPFTPVVWILAFVCLGLLVAVVTMAAIIAGHDSNSSNGGGITTVICPGGNSASPIVGPSPSPSPSPSPAMLPPPFISLYSPPPPPPTSPDGPAAEPMCPVETMYWEFPDSIYGGYKGCVSQVGMHPCAQDGFTGIGYPENPLNRPVLYNTDTGMCEDTQWTAETMNLWILWGLPMDNAELIKRTGGEMPVVSFPFDRATYPSYFNGDHGDESLSAQAKQKEFLVYMNAFTNAELDEFTVRITEGAESGMTIMWGAKALELARTTCNRHFYVLMEVPAYGYSPSTSASWANDEAGSFYEGEECPCFAAGTCQDPSVQISAVGWAPGTPLPVRNNSNDVPYAANSASDASPWFESLVFPENPSGTVKTVQHPNPNRRVCDGVYLYPMYFGANDWEVPDSRPDCASWSFSITKAYSASVRAGTVLFKSYEASTEAHEDILSSVHSMSNGLLSEWSWRGQVQILDHFMEKPYTDETSWLGAYKTIIDDKWKYVIDGFANCPVIEIVNDYAGAYVWFKKKPEYIGLEDSFITSFFRDTLGIWATTYNWGFRGANPADMYGDGYSVTDFTRMHLYRDISVYEEVGRRAAIVCSGGKVADHLLTYEEWATVEGDRLNPSTRRHALAAEESMSAVTESREDTRRRLRDNVPRLSEAHVENHVENFHAAKRMDRNLAEFCAPEFSMSCMMKYTGGKYADSGDKRVLL